MITVVDDQHFFAYLSASCCFYAPLLRLILDFSAGTQEDWRDDADDFPQEALGEPLGDWEGEVWVDINNEASHWVPAYQRGVCCPVCCTLAEMA